MLVYTSSEVGRLAAATGRRLKNELFLQVFRGQDGADVDHLYTDNGEDVDFAPEKL